MLDKYVRNASKICKKQKPSPTKKITAYKQRYTL